MIERQAMNGIIEETADMVYGRLLESAHMGGYAAERAAREFKWLLTDDRWKQVGPRFDDIDKFLGSINLAQYRITIDDRQEIVQLLDAARATQRQGARNRRRHRQSQSCSKWNKRADYPVARQPGTNRSCSKWNKAARVGPGPAVRDRESVSTETSACH